MSQLLQVATRAGGLPAVDGTLAPEYVEEGVPYDGGVLAVDTVSAINHYSQGVPFTATGRLATGGGAPDYYGSGGAPFTAAGRLCVSTTLAAEHYSASIPYASTSAISTITAVDPNVYPNRLLAGGSDIVADVFTTMPTSHVATAFGGVPADATYLGAGNPAYTFVGTGNSRFAISMNINTATNRGVTLQGGRKYRFSAEVQSIGEAAVATRLINAAALTGGAILIDGPLVVPDGTWQSVYVDFGLVNITDTLQLRHGIGMFNAVTTVGATQQTRNLSLRDIGAYP